MILKKLYEEYGFNIESLLLKEYKNIGLTQDELNVLFILLSNKSKRKLFSISSISRRLDFNQNQVAEIVDELMNKEVLKIILETTNNRSREVYSLSGLFKKLEDLLNEEINEKNKEKNKSLIAETIVLLTKKLNRELRAEEYGRVRLWYSKFNFKHEDIINVIESSKSNLNILYVEKVLSMDVVNTSEIDEETEKVLDKIFKEL